MANGNRVDPYKGFRFRVEIDGIQQAGFTECSAVGSHLEVVEYREGGETATVRKLPGKASYPDITLKWGTTDSHELYDWHLAAVRGDVSRKTGSVVQLDDTGAEKVRWHFYQAWPSKWDGPSFSAKGNDVSIQTLTLTCERIELG
jgi:phage tail-like protein